ncbi:unnamed protein product [Notodromas monacha]|uniref:Uncharacterized protein n=1 Tax=Notodromas monacha TaxID=399045 RepID=A0A7R9BKX6_9CRUS|nr:unnamed protein product [Notodromas monacha]CAG0917381.1 unnamed protein product [Notodromas monacha]
MEWKGTGKKLVNGANKKTTGAREWQASKLNTGGIQGNPVTLHEAAASSTRRPLRCVRTRISVMECVLNLDMILFLKQANRVRKIATRLEILQPPLPAFPSSDNAFVSRGSRPMTLNDVEHGGGNPGFWQNSMRMPSTPSPRLPTPGPASMPSMPPGGPTTPGTPGVPGGPLTPQPHSSPSPGYFGGPPPMNTSLGPMSGGGPMPMGGPMQMSGPPQYMHQGPMPPHPMQHHPGGMMGPGGGGPMHHQQMGPGTPGPPTPMGHHPGQSPGHGPSPRPMGHPMGPMSAGSPVGPPHPNMPPNMGPNMGPQMGMHGPYPPPQRRHAPLFGQPDYRIFELNKRLQQRSEDMDTSSLWWDAFATEFFEDEATLTLTFCLEDGPKRYTIGRTLIPRYFRSLFEGGVTDVYFHLRHPKESFHNPTITLDCDQCTMVSHHGKPLFTKCNASQSDRYRKAQCPRDLNQASIGLMLVFMGISRVFGASMPTDRVRGYLGYLGSRSSGPASSKQRGIDVIRGIFLKQRSEGEMQQQKNRRFVFVSHDDE